MDRNNTLFEDFANVSHVYPQEVRRAGEQKVEIPANSTVVRRGDMLVVRHPDIPTMILPTFDALIDGQS